MSSTLHKKTVYEQAIEQKLLAVERARVEATELLEWLLGRFRRQGPCDGQERSAWAFDCPRLATVIDESPGAAVRRLMEEDRKRGCYA